MTRIDARGMRCPWPALRAARALRNGPLVEIVADDPAAARELAALARERDLPFERVEAIVFRIGMELASTAP